MVMQPIQMKRRLRPQMRPVKRQDVTIKPVRNTAEKMTVAQQMSRARDKSTLSPRSESGVFDENTFFTAAAELATPQQMSMSHVNERVVSMAQGRLLRLPPGCNTGRRKS